MAEINFAKYALSQELMELCLAGLKKMDSGNDAAHNSEHIARILLMLDRFLAENAEMIGQIEMKVIVPAACWHDCWRAQRPQYNLFDLLINEFWDGKGSADLFLHEAKRRNINMKLAQEIAYVIEKHSSFQIFPSKTPEARLFFDLDEIDKYSVQRLEDLKKMYIYTNKLTIAQAKAAKFFFEKFMKNGNGKEMHFSWTKNAFIKAKKLFMFDAQKILDDYPRLLAQAKRKK